MCQEKEGVGNWFLKSKQDIFFEVVQLVQGNVVVVVVGKEYYKYAQHTKDVKKKTGPAAWQEVGGR